MENIVVCCHCKSRLFHCAAVGRDLPGECCRPEDFNPVNSEVPRPKRGEPLLCHYCKLPFFVRAGAGIVLELEEGYYWPHPPI